ncbi:hypothetical protein FSP39_017939 [Pinctada imbricata]|uniref:Amine oxidase n=1 Tax=Pinctada imbricata TaxID=66713 RepID=A0AA88XKP5_PINIB|nr:hypothetical protein FSP39_017939 [Pinctada imbricata]
MAAFGARLKNCGVRCLGLKYLNSFSPASSGEKKRKFWYWFHYPVEYFLLHPVDFAVLLTSHDDSFIIECIWYAGRKYHSLNSLLDLYMQNRLPLNISTFPHDDSSIFSKLYRRGKTPSLSEKRDPVQFYPDGQRYTITYRHIEYMEWSFDFRLSTSYGPQIYDVRFRGNRIAYEIGLQEISVYYSGDSPQQRFSDFIDSAELFGSKAKGLVPGVDCPELSTFVGAFNIGTSLQPTEIINAFCVFEWNTGEPLRRHYSKSKYASNFFEGLQTTVLILRTILTISNYDYIIDFRFNQNGVMETKAFSTGYILANAYAEDEKRYAFQLHNQIVGNYHLHLFHFKADLDIGGTSNRYETLDITAHTEENPFSSKENATDTQGQIKRTLKQAESDAAYHYEFEQPKYHIFYRQNNTDKYGNNKAYRLLVHGFAKQILPPGVDKEPSVSWSRYQTAVTRRKETERHSSTLYAMFDTLDPVVNFTSFISDNESIVDEDLVTWITLGVHHIPHTEDLPIVTTPGMALSFLLQPFNFFPEDPAMTSPNAIRLELNKKNDLSSGVKVERYGQSPTIDTCRVSSNNFFDVINEDYSVIFTD